MAMDDELSSGESSTSLTSRDDATIAADPTADETPERTPLSQLPSSKQSLPAKEPSQTPRRPAFLSCKWPEGSDWAVALSGELETLGLTAVHDARHRLKLADIEALIRDSSCVILLITPGFYHALANKPPGNRALKEVKFALQYHKPLLAVVHASYCGQNPLPGITSWRELTTLTDDPGEGAQSPPWTIGELATVAAASTVLMFKGADGFEGYQKELVRKVAEVSATSLILPELSYSPRGSRGLDGAGGGLGRRSGDGIGSTRAGAVEAEAEERRMKEVLRVAGLSRRLPALLDAGISSTAVLEVALRRGRLSAKPLNWHESWERRLAQVLEAWPVLCSQPEWLRTAPEGLVPQLVALLAQEEAKEYDREGRARPRRGAVSPLTSLNVSGQGPVVMGHRGGVAVAALMRDVGSAMAGAARRRQELLQQQTENGDGPPTAVGVGFTGTGSTPRDYARPTSPPQWRLYGTATTMLTLTTVDLTDCDLGTAAAGEVLLAAGVCPCLETLLLGGNGIDDGILRSFDALMRKLYSDSKTPAAVPGTPLISSTLESLTGSGGLRTLGLERNHITDTGGSELLSVAFSYPCSLTSLDLSGNRTIGHITAEAYVKLLRAASDGGPQRLTHVNLIDTGMDELTLAALTPVMLTACRKTNDGAAAAANPVDELDFSGITVDLEVLNAFAAVSRLPEYRGGPRVVNLSGANLRLEPGSHLSPGRSRLHTHTGSSKRTTISEFGTPERRTGSGAGGSGSGCNVTTLASALLHSTKIEELRLGWCGLGGAGLRILVTGLMAAAGSTGTGPAPLSKLTLLDLTGNKLGPEGVTLLGALLPVNLPSLRHLILDECGFGGRELGILTGMLDVCFWVVEAVQGALCLILNDTVTGGMRGIWTEPMAGAAERNTRHRLSVGEYDTEDTASGAAERLASLFQLWLSMDPSAAAAEVKRLLLPASAAAAARDQHYALRRASMALGAGDPSPLAGLGCLLVHPVIQPVLEALRNTMDALTAEAEALRASGGPGNPVQLPLSTPAAQAAFRSLDAAVVHLRGCADVPGLQTLSLGRNGFAHEAGAPLGAAVAMSSGLRYLGLHGIVQPPAPPPVAGSAAVAAAAAITIVTGGPLGAAAAAARDTRFLLRRLYPQEAMVLESGDLGSLSGEPSYNAQHKDHHQHQHNHHHHHNHHRHHNRRSTLGDSTRESNYGGGSLPPHAHPHSHLPQGPNSFAQPSASSPAGTSSPAHQSLDADRKNARRFLPGIRCLDLTDAGISNHNVAHLAELVCHLPLLEQLILDFNFLSSYPSSENSFNERTNLPPQPADATAAMFADLATMPCLSYLSLNYACDAGAMMSLADYLLPAPPTHQPSSSSIAPPSSSNSTAPLPPPASANLRVLSLVGCPLDGTVARRVARAFAHNTTLQVLRLGGGDPPEGVGPIGSRALSEALAGHRGLVELSLSGVGLTDNAARIFADALPLLTSLCKLDLSYNSLTGYGINVLATALLARNRNSIGAASENKLNMQVHGNRMSEELEARMQALSVPAGMTHMEDRMPVVPWYGPPPPRSAGGNFGYGGSSGGGGYFASNIAAAPVPTNRGGVASGSSSNVRANLPAPPSLAPPPTLVRAPVPKQGPGTPLQASRGSRGSWGSSRSNAGPGTQSQILSTVPTTVLNSAAGERHTLLTAVPPPPPARRGSDDAGILGQSSFYAESVMGNNRGPYATSTTNLQKIYGANNMYLNGQRRSSPNGPQGHRPTSSPTIKAGLPMSIGQLRHGAPGAPYALSLLNAGQNPLLSMNRKYPSRTGTGGGASDANSGNALPSVRKSQNANSSGGGEGSDIEGDGAPRVVNSPAANKIFGASEHLQQRIKCHQPDWVQRMQEDYYKRITTPPNPVSSPPPVVAPSEHLFKPLRCHDAEWQRNMQHQLTALETAPEQQPKPVPGAPTAANAVSIVAAIQRGAIPLKSQSAGESHSPVRRSPRPGSSRQGTPPRSRSPPYVASPARSASPPHSSSPPGAASPRPAATPPRVSEPSGEPSPGPASQQTIAASGDGEAEAVQASAHQAATPSEVQSEGVGGTDSAEGNVVEDSVGEAVLPAAETGTSQPVDPVVTDAEVAEGSGGTPVAIPADLDTRESLEDSIEVLAIRNTGARRSKIEMVRIKTFKAKDPKTGGPTMVLEEVGSEGAHDEEEGSEEEDEDGVRPEDDIADSAAAFQEDEGAQAVSEGYIPSGEEAFDIAAIAAAKMPWAGAAVGDGDDEDGVGDDDEYRDLKGSEEEGRDEADGAEAAMALQRMRAAQQDDEAGVMGESEEHGQLGGYAAAGDEAGDGRIAVEAEAEEGALVAAGGSARRCSGTSSANGSRRSSRNGGRGRGPLAGAEEGSGALMEGDGLPAGLGVDH